MSSSPRADGGRPTVLRDLVRVVVVTVIAVACGAGLAALTGRDVSEGAVFVGIIVLGGQLFSLMTARVLRPDRRPRRGP